MPGRGALSTDQGSVMAGESRDNALDHQDALGLGQHNIRIEGLPAHPGTEIPPDRALHIIHNFLAIQFPLLHPAAPGPVPRSDPDGTQP